MPSDPTFAAAVYAVLVGILTAAGAVIVATLKVRGWVRDAAREAMEAEEGRRRIVSAIKDSAEIAAMVERLAVARTEQALAPLSAKLDALLVAVKDLCRKLDEQSDRTRKLELDLARLPASTTATHPPQG